MSYHQPNPSYYQTFQPDTPFHAGSEGWTKAPWVTWGDNPNLAGRRALTTDGLGSVIAISGLGGGQAAIGIGADSADVTAALQARAAEPAWLRIARTLATGACAYHGYKRNDSVGWSVVWALWGGLVPVLALPVALAQGFGKPAKRPAMAANRRRTTRNHRRRAKRR